MQRMVLVVPVLWREVVAAWIRATWIRATWIRATWIRATWIRATWIRATWILMLCLFASCARPVSGASVAAPFDPFDDDAGYVFGFASPEAATGDDESATVIEDAASPVPVAPTAADAANTDPGAPGDVTMATGDEPPVPVAAADAGPDGACEAPPEAGDLAIDELMIASVAGAGDYGEWLEVRSTRDCALDLRGLHGECPRGAKVATFDVTQDLWVAAGGTFVVADSADPALNHDVPGPIVAWSGRVGDVLRNQGTTITLTVSGTRIDSVTYPALSLTVGASLSFPTDCDPETRADWTRWQWSTASWFPAFFGTPNAPNDDIHCP
jgi:hypothetical protein